MRDVVVIGAGPAGSVTADRLAKAGHDVLLLEEHPEVGRPVHCTGLLGDEAFAEFDLPRQLIHGRAEAARFWGAAGRSVQVQSGAVKASIIDRAGLDAYLADRAVASGAELRTDARVDAVTIDADCARISLRGDQVLAARVVVLACGANYRFHKQLGLGMPAAFLQSAQTEIEFPQQPGIEVRFGRNVAPQGFAWLVPFKTDDHRARIGLMSESLARERFTAFLATLRKEAGLGGEHIAIEPRLKMLPLAPVSKTYGDRVVAVGDAAGLVKPTTGGGIYYGMLSGAIAGDVLDRGLRRNDLQASGLARYEKVWQKQLGAEIRAGLRFRNIVSRLADESIDALIDLAAVNGVVPLLQRTASFNWHRKAAMALLGHPAFREIACKAWTRGAGPA